MKKNIRFALKMKDDVEVRDISALKEYFSIDKVVEYFQNGKLLTWLNDRYLEEEAEAVESLDSNDEEIARKLCEIFGISYSESLIEDAELAKERERKLSILREMGDFEEFELMIAQVAFDDEELLDLLDDNVSPIYLCGEIFHIPHSKKNMSYIGVNNPVLVINSKEVVNWKEKNIKFENIRFDEQYAKIESDAGITTISQAQSNEKDKKLKKQKNVRKGNSSFEIVASILIDDDIEVDSYSKKLYDHVEDLVMGTEF